MDRTLFAATLAVAAIASLAYSLAPFSPTPVPTASQSSATAGARPILPEDFLADGITAAVDVADEESDRMALEVVDILLRDGRDLLAG